jgi:CheY-like chemotaxis protein
MKHTVLAISGDPRTLEPIEPVLQRDSFSVHRASSVEAALELCRELEALDLLIAGYPLDTEDIGAFANEVRRLRTPTPPLMFLLTPESAIGSHDRIADEHLQILSLDHSPEDLQREILVRFGRRPRVAQRVLVRLEVHLETSSVLRACQTHNLSETGMAVRTNEVYPLGTMVEYDLSLENDTRPVHGMAEAVRHIDPRHERIRGVGLRFLRFRGDGLERLQAYLGSRRAA